MNNWDCPPRHSYSAVGERVNTFRFYTGHYARPRPQAGLYGWGGTAAHFHRMSARELLWLAPGRLRRSVASQQTLQKFKASFCWSCAAVIASDRRCARVFCKCSQSGRGVMMMVMIITMADWWRRGDNYCVEDGDHDADDDYNSRLVFASISQRVETPPGGAASDCRCFVYIRIAFVLLHGRFASGEVGVECAVLVALELEAAPSMRTCHSAAASVNIVRLGCSSLCSILRTLNSIQYRSSDIF